MIYKEDEIKKALKRVAEKHSDEIIAGTAEMRRANISRAGKKKTALVIIGFLLIIAVTLVPLGLLIKTNAELKSEVEELKGNAPERENAENNLLDYYYDETEQMSASYPEYSVEKLVEECSLVAKVRCVGQGSTFTVKGVPYSPDGDPVPDGLFTEYALELEEVFRGNYEKGKTVKLRVCLNTMRTMQIQLSEDVNMLRINEEYIVFLYKTHVGGLYETGDDYFEIKGFGQGIFNYNSDNTVSTYLVTTTYDELIKDINKYNDVYPVNEYWWKDRLERELMKITNEKEREMFNYSIKTYAEVGEYVYEGIDFKTDY